MRIVMALVAATCLQGCGLSCNLMYAPSSTSVELDGGDWPAGTWEIELNGYNQIAMCVVTLPDDGGLVSCTGNATLELDEAGERIASIRAEGFAPESFQAQLYRDGLLVAERSLTPEYDTDEPNGKGCGLRKVTTVEFSL